MTLLSKQKLYLVNVNVSVAEVRLRMRTSLSFVTHSPLRFVLVLQVQIYLYIVRHYTGTTLHTHRVFCCILVNILCREIIQGKVATSFYHIHV